MKQAFSNIKLWARAFTVALLWLGVCGFCFYYTGRTFFQLSLCFIASVSLSALLYHTDRGGCSVGLAQLIFVCLWLVCALGYQVKLQLEQGWPGYWIYCFYFDSLLTQGTIWLGSSLVVALWRLFDRSAEPKRFFRLSGVAFVIFYVFLLVYSFYLARMKPGTSYPLNLNFLTTIQAYRAKISENPYEVWMMILGNLFYFTPLGYMLTVALRRRSAGCRTIILLLFAPVTFFLLEYSQYVFQIGFCEIDDMMMNAFGFWFGAVLAPLSDWFAKRVTKRRVDHFWL